MKRKSSKHSFQRFCLQPTKDSIQNLELEVDEETTNELILKELEKQYRKYSKKYEGYDLKQRLTQALAKRLRL